MTSQKIRQQQLPMAILIPCRNSHPFEKRRIPVLTPKNEEDSIKIGRSVVKLQPAENNAIFDCKVLSRNHAILWRDEQGRFLLKDTKSSNGTFINSDRISESGKESEPREIFSGDILQFGVEIIENTKKIASACVICIIRLLNENGEECQGSSSGDQLPLSLRSEQILLGKYTFVKNDKTFHDGSICQGSDFS